MKIERIETRVVEYALPGIFRPAWTPGAEKTGHGFLLLTLVTDTGIEGHATGLRYRVFTDKRRTQMEKGGLGGPEALQAVHKYLEALLIGCDPHRIDPLIKTLQNASFFGKGRHWYVEMALWDVIAKAANVPLYKLLGGTRDKVPGYASWGQSFQPQDAYDKAKQYIAMGYKAVKVRVHAPTVAEDVAQVAAVREAGPDLTIMVDANQARLANTAHEWDMKRAVDACRKMEALNIRWMEEPLKQWDQRGLAELRKSTSVRIAGAEYDENLMGFVPLLDCFDIFQPDAVRAGGIWGTRKIAILAEAFEKECSVHTWGDGLLMHPSLQLAAAIPNCQFIELPDDRPNWAPEVRDHILHNPVLIDKDGMVALPAEPGMGYRLNWDIIDRCTLAKA